MDIGGRDRMTHLKNNSLTLLNFREFHGHLKNISVYSKQSKCVMYVMMRFGFKESQFIAQSNENTATMFLLITCKF